MSYREALDLLSKMPQILAEIGLEAGDSPHHSTLVEAFYRLQRGCGECCCASQRRYDTSDHAAMNALSSTAKPPASSTSDG